MENARWEARAIARCISERELVLKFIKGKHLYNNSWRMNYMLILQCEEKNQSDRNSVFLHEEPDPSDPKTPRDAFSL